MEKCAGCGAEAPEHPMIAVVKGKTGFTDVPVCKACHENPSGRKTLIKGHFFNRKHRKVAVALAGSDDIRG